MIAVGKGFVGIIDDKTSKEVHKEIARKAKKLRNFNVLMYLFMLFTIKF